MCFPGMRGMCLPKMFHSDVSVFGSYNEQVDFPFAVLRWIGFVLELVEEQQLHCKNLITKHIK